MINRESQTRSYISGRGISQVGPIQNFNCRDYKELNDLGIDLPEFAIRKMIESRGMDALQPLVTTASMPVPVQFLQQFLPGLVYVATAKRKADEVLGITTAGDWYDEQIVQGILEPLGNPQPYGDYANTSFSSVNVNWIYRTVVRFEHGIRIGMLEEARMAQVNVDFAASARNAAAEVLEIERNTVAFFGYNNGLNNTYGFLTDPELPNYYTVPVGATGFTEWSTKSLLEIENDIRTMLVNLRTQSGEVVDPEDTEITLVLPSAVVDYLSVASDFNVAVRDWLTKSYPRVRVVSAVQLNGANGGANVGYMFAEKIDDQSTDGGRVWDQLVPAKFMVTGVDKRDKYYIENYVNATAGALLKRPYAVIRNSGI